MIITLYTIPVIMLTKLLLFINNLTTLRPRMGVGGKAIPPYIDKIENIQSDAEFILLVEKEAAYMRMAVRF